MFFLECTDYKLWNPVEFVKYLADNQDKDIIIHINPEAIDINELRIFDYIDCFKFKSVIIYTRNQLQQHPIYKIEYIRENPFIESSVSINPLIQTWNQTKTFLCVYGRPIASRLGFASWLHHHYPDETLIQFTTHHNDDNPNFEWNKLAGYDLDSVKYATDLVQNLPIQTVNNMHYNNLRSDWNWQDKDMINLYKSIFVDVVAENHNQGETFFPTEKIARPIYCKKPFIVHGNKDYLDYLHQMGFRTFHDYWSQNYDGYDQKDRYCAMLQIFAEIGSKSKKELKQMLDDMQPILDHNYNLLVDKAYNYNIKKIV
jgi:hypothetical protein